MAKKASRGTSGNFVSEWFGHRIHPIVVSNAQAVADQTSERCPFLSAATGESRACIKNPQSKGVCSVSCVSNGPRQDWLVCPYRALSPEIVAGAVRRLFGLGAGSNPFVTPAVNLMKSEVRDDILSRLHAGQPVFTYFDEKMGGELSIPATDSSPEFAFDVTIVEMTLVNDAPHISRFGILEIQTTDFHGSYQHAVRNLKDGLRLHPGSFAATLQANQHWLSEGVEGPNIANVFKRTFYQMMFKFQLGHHDRCAGCVLAIPQSVWDSWQRHLGAPTLAAEPDGTHSLLAPGRSRPNPWPAWIFVFDSDAAAPTTPSPIEVRKVIGTDAPAFSYWALEVAPEAALSNIDAEAGFLAGMSRRLKAIWPELARTVVAEIAAERPAKIPGNRAKRVRTVEVPIEALEKQTGYQGPSEEAVKGDESDQG
jgi:hypothetical protein